MKEKLKELQKEDAERILAKADSEGFAYAASEGYMDELRGTKYELVLDKFLDGLEQLEVTLFRIRDEFEIEDL